MFRSTLSGAGDSRRRFPRTGPAIAGLAAVLAVWFGLAAPSVSPVAPASVAQEQTAASEWADREVGPQLPSTAATGD